MALMRRLNPTARYHACTYLRWLSSQVLFALQYSEGQRFLLPVSVASFITSVLYYTTIRYRIVQPFNHVVSCRYDYVFSLLCLLNVNMGALDLSRTLAQEARYDKLHLINVGNVKRTFPLYFLCYLPFPCIRHHIHSFPQCAALLVSWRLTMHIPSFTN